MNEQQLEDSRNGWREWCICIIITFIIGYIVLVIVIPINMKEKYQQGVNDTLNNYTCISHPDYSQVKCPCCGEFCSINKCNLTYGTYKINSYGCKDDK